MRCGNTAKNGITQQAGAEAAERRIGHDRHAVPFTPWQQVVFNAAVAEVVKESRSDPQMEDGTDLPFGGL